MSIAQKTLTKRVLKWLAQRRIELAENLLASVETYAPPDIEAAWLKEIAAHPHGDFAHAHPTLILLKQSPLERLQRSLFHGRTADLPAPLATVAQEGCRHSEAD